MTTRRRFLALSAAAVTAPGLAPAHASPAPAAPVKWRGTALGAEVSLTLNAAPALADKAIQVAKETLAYGEALFSLYAPGSALSQLNATGRLMNPDPQFADVMRLCDRIHHATGGLFDPSIQPLWSALARHQEPHTAQAHVGWGRVSHARDRVTLGQGQALTFNGVAQGFLTQLLKTRWQAMGLDNCLINLGEFASLGGAFRLGIADPTHGMIAVHPLTGGAIATSSPQALPLSRDRGHILHPSAQAPQWSTVSVAAQDAGVADAASTGFCLMSKAQIQAACARLPEITSVYLVSQDGHVTRL